MYFQIVVQPFDNSPQNITMAAFGFKAFITRFGIEQAHKIATRSQSGLTTGSAAKGIKLIQIGRSASSWSSWWPFLLPLQIGNVVKTLIYQCPTYFCNEKMPENTIA